LASWLGGGEIWGSVVGWLDGLVSVLGWLVPVQWVLGWVRSATWFAGLGFSDPEF